MQKVLNLKINLTEEHIKKGKAGSETSCPIVKAIKAQGYPWVRVNGETIVVKNENGQRFVGISKPVNHFVEVFDAENLEKKHGHMSWFTPKQVVATIKPRKFNIKLKLVEKKDKK